MRKLKLGLLLLLCCTGPLSYAQFAINTTAPCEGGEPVKVYLPFDAVFSSLCDDDPQNPVYDGLKYYMFDIIVPAGGTAFVTQGQENQITTNSTLHFNASANSYTNPSMFIVHILGYKRRLIGGTYDQCFAQDFFVYPKRNVWISGPTSIETPGPCTYTVTNIPGITWTWSIPPGWSTVSSTVNTITVLPGPGNGNSTQTITATPSQTLGNVCGMIPLSLNIALSGCAFSGVTNFPFCTPQTDWTTAFRSFEYGNPYEEGNGNKFPRMMGDFNGDGKQDLIGFGNTSVAVGLSTGSYFNVSTWTTGFTYGNGGSTQAKYPRHVGDFNGDGKDDILGFGHDYTAVGLSNGSSFSTSGFAQTPYFSYSQGFTGNHLPRKIGDFNGDGKDDIIGFGHSSVAVGLSTGNSFSVSGWTTSFNTNDYGDEDKWPRMLGDFNGDGKTDVIGFGNTAVAVGLSTGSGFNISTWTTEFTYGLHGGIRQSNTPRGIGDFNGDGKDDIILFGQDRIWVALSTGTSFAYASEWLRDGFVGQFWDNPGLSSLTTRPNILIVDVNADGKDDLVGFNEQGTAVSYSTGARFECPAEDEMMALQSMTYSNDARFAGNFDNTDDQLELVALDDDFVRVMNCRSCTTSVAAVTVNGHHSMVPETGYQGWNMDVYRFCSNTLSLDVSQTQCEDRYFVTVKEFDINTWTFQNTIHETGWIIQKAPHTINLSSLNLTPGKLYWVDFGVGPNWNVKSFCVRITNPAATFTLNPNETRTISGFGQTTHTINGYCSNVLSSGANGSGSTCYDEYRYEIQEVIPPLMFNTGSVIQQIPAGGGWNPGPMTSNGFNVSNLASGKIYALRLYVRRNGITSSFTRYVERTGCVIGLPPKEIGFTTAVNNGPGESLLYPNPALNHITVNITDYGVPVVSGSIYDSHGRCVRQLELNGNSHNTVDINSLAPGIYFMMLQANGKSEKISFVKQ